VVEARTEADRLESGDSTSSPFLWPDPGVRAR